jgi:hypothetical protein
MNDSLGAADGSGLRRSGLIFWLVKVSIEAKPLGEELQSRGEERGGKEKGKRE